jgi:prolyl-tRNA synthetase
LPSKNSDQPLSTAEKIYQDLLRARIDVLYDDRQESPGVKFNDADLIGIPIRITVAEKSLNEGMVEVKLRHEGEKKLISLEELLPATMHTLLRLERDAAQKLAN